jgi:hypothetical protein
LRIRRHEVVSGTDTDIEHANVKDKSSMKMLITAIATMMALPVMTSDTTAEEKALPKHVHLRGHLHNSALRFKAEKKGRVAFIGGSITQGTSWRVPVCESIRKRFLGTEFDFVSAGLSSTCSTTGAMRLNAHVFMNGRVDLFFVEFAVNDNQDAAHPPKTCLRGMEGILRQALLHNPEMDIIVQHFPNEAHLKRIQDGGMPHEIEQHEKAAAAYGVTTINIAEQVAHGTVDGKPMWKTYGGVHPNKAGGLIVAANIDAVFDHAWSETSLKGARIEKKEIPGKLLDEKSYIRGRFIDIKKAVLKSGWKIGVPEWKSLKGGKRKEYTSIPLLTADNPGAELELEFNGTAIGVFVVAGPDAGVLEYEIDGTVRGRTDLYHRYSRGLHYPRSCMFAAELDDGRHRLRLRTTSAEGRKQGGQAVRIITFIAN